MGCDPPRAASRRLEKMAPHHAVRGDLVLADAASALAVATGGGGDDADAAAASAQGGKAAGAGRSHKEVE